jgi:hypothetical protein
MGVRDEDVDAIARAASVRGSVLGRPPPCSLSPQGQIAVCRRPSGNLAAPTLEVATSPIHETLTRINESIPQQHSRIPVAMENVKEFAEYAMPRRTQWASDD